LREGSALVKYGSFSIDHRTSIVWHLLIEGEVLGGVGDEAVFPAFDVEDFLPEVGGVFFENEFEGGGVGEPGFSFQFGFELAGAPAGVSGEEAELLSGGERLAEVNEFFEGMAEVEVGHDVGVGKEIVGVKVAEGAGLNGAPEVEVKIFDGVREISDQDFANFILAGLIEDEAKGALGVMLANENDGAIEKRTAQLPAIQQQFAFERLEFVSHKGSQAMCMIVGGLTRCCLILGVKLLLGNDEEMDGDGFVRVGSGALGGGVYDEFG
jgi:hypothetical protein